MCSVPPLPPILILKTCIQRGQCKLFSVVFTPSAPIHHGSVWVLPVLSLLLKVPKCEIFDRSDFPDFYTINLTLGRL